MVLKYLCLVLFGATLILASPASQESVDRRRVPRGLIEVDDTNNHNGAGGFVENEINNDVSVTDYNPPLPESTPDVPQEFPVEPEYVPQYTDQNSENSEENKEDSSITDKVGSWIEGIGQKWKEHLEGKKEAAKDVWDHLKNKWQKWHL